MGIEELSPEERVERVRMALAEAGYPDDEVWAHPDGRGVRIVGAAPLAVRWTASRITGSVVRCWPCCERWPLRIDMPTPCDHDPLTSAWPEAVR